MRRTPRLLWPLILALGAALAACKTTQHGASSVKDDASSNPSPASPSANGSANDLFTILL